jgi:hypothetical protein
MTAPERLDAWRDSLSIITPNGLNNHGTTCGSQSGQRVTLANSDTARSGNGVEWRYDTLLAKAQAGTAVPALPPSSQPAWILSDSNYASPATGLPFGFARNAIHVIFKTGTSQALRQQAIDQVGGVVVGGIPLTGGDGYYDVTIPDSGQGVQLQTAVTSLRSMSQVDGASVIVRSTSPYLRPHDGAGWQACHLNPDSAGSEQNYSM